MNLDARLPPSGMTAKQSQIDEAIITLRREFMAATMQLQEEHVPVKSRVWISVADASTATLQSVIGGGR